jgi:hypothetical protein
MYNTITGQTMAAADTNFANLLKGANATATTSFFDDQRQQIYVGIGNSGFVLADSVITFPNQTGIANNNFNATMDGPGAYLNGALNATIRDTVVYNQQTGVRPRTAATSPSPTWRCSTAAPASTRPP